jgi:hypothetical protein
MKRIAICAHTLQRRINREFDRQYGKGKRVLRKTNPYSSQREALGEYFVLDTTKTRGVRETHIRLDAFARELGVLQPYERLKK